MQPACADRWRQLEAELAEKQARVTKIQSLVAPARDVDSAAAELVHLQAAIAKARDELSGAGLVPFGRFAHAMHRVDGAKSIDQINSELEGLNERL